MMQKFRTISLAAANSPTILTENRYHDRMNLFKLFIILTFCGCESKKSEIRSSEIQDNGKMLTTNNIIVGLYGGDLTNGEMMFDGDQELEYYSNDKYLGDSDNGVQNLYALLKSTESDAITIQNPATSFVGGLSHKPGLRDEAYKYPYIKNPKLSKAVNEELDRIRGWKDSTLPVWPPRQQ